MVKRLIIENQKRNMVLLFTMYGCHFLYIRQNILSKLNCRTLFLSFLQLLRYYLTTYITIANIDNCSQTLNLHQDFFKALFCRNVFTYCQILCILMQIFFFFNALFCYVMLIRPLQYLIVINIMDVSTAKNSSCLLQHQQ